MLLYSDALRGMTLRLRYGAWTEARRVKLGGVV